MKVNTVSEVYRWIAVAVLAFIPLPSGAYAEKPEYIGNESCKKCHEKLFASWEKSVHAQAFVLLKPKVRGKHKEEAKLKIDTDYQGDKSCMPCHVTGLDNGGFSFDDPKDEWKGIGCEECHGGAEKWLAIHDRKSLKRRERKLKQAGLIQPFDGQTVCLRCHGNQNSPYKYRDLERDRDWTSMEFAESYHILPEPK